MILFSMLNCIVCETWKRERKEEVGGRGEGRERERERKESSLVYIVKYNIQAILLNACRNTLLYFCTFHRSECLDQTAI